MTIRLMRCTVSHHRGDKFISEGTILPEGDPDIIPEFFALYEIQEPATRPPRSVKSSRK